MFKPLMILELRSYHELWSCSIYFIYSPRIDSWYTVQKLRDIQYLVLGFVPFAKSCSFFWIMNSLNRLLACVSPSNHSRGQFGQSWPSFKSTLWQKRVEYIHSKTHYFCIWSWKSPIGKKSADTFSREKGKKGFGENSRWLFRSPAFRSPFRRRESEENHGAINFGLGSLAKANPAKRVDRPRPLY